MTASARCSLTSTSPHSESQLMLPRILLPYNLRASITIYCAAGRRCRVALTPRRALFWLHLTAGVIAGTIILFLAITGACLAYERQIITWADRAQRVSESDTRQSLPTLLESAKNYALAQPAAIVIHNDPAAP